MTIDILSRHAKDNLQRRRWQCEDWYYVTDWKGDLHRHINRVHRLSTSSKSDTPSQDLPGRRKREPSRSNSKDREAAVDKPCSSQVKDDVPLYWGTSTSTPYIEPEDRKENSVVEEIKRAEKEFNDMCLYKDESYDYRINDDGTMLGRTTKGVDIP